MRGTAEWGWPYVIESETEKIMVKTAVAIHPDQQFSQPVQHTENDIWIQFTSGVLQVQK
jgi:hypothetical protein